MKSIVQAAAIVLMFSCLVAHGAEERKKRVAVLEFEYATVRTEVSSVFGTDVNVGKGVADLLVKYLVRDGTYAVIERRALEAVLTEQDFSTSNRGDPASAAHIGKMLGVDAIILGSITQFGGERQAKSRGGIGGIPSAAGGGIRRNDETKAIVTLDARIVDVDSGEILAVADGTGESSRSGKSAGGFILGKGFFGFGGIDISSSKFQETIIGEAVKHAVEQMSAGVISARPRLLK